MSNFRKKFTSIKDKPIRPRLPRLGYIRLGVKVRKQQFDPKRCVMKDKENQCQGCWNCTYPRETDYFVCPPEIKEHYGDEPKELRVMLPINDMEACFNTRYVFYGMSRGWKCMGNGEEADRVNPETGEIEEVECPGPDNCAFHLTKNKKPQCSMQATLQVIVLDELNHPINNTWGVYWVVTGSGTSRTDILSGMMLLDELTGGRIALIPLTLRRITTEMHRDGKKEVHWTMQLIPKAGMDQLAFYRANPQMIYTGQTYQLPEPEIIHPATQGDPVVVEMDDVKDAEGDGICEACLQPYSEHAEDGSCVFDGIATTPDVTVGTSEEEPTEYTVHPEGCTCEICMATELVKEVMGDKPEPTSQEPPKNGNEYDLFAQLQNELSDLSDDKSKTDKDITAWQKANAIRIGKLPPKTNNGLDQQSLLKIANQIKRKKRNAE